MPIRKKRLIDGYHHFRAGDYKKQKALYEDLGTHGQHPNDGSYVGKWVSLINGVRDRILAKNYSPEERNFQMELEVVRQSIANLMSFPFVKDAVEKEGLALQGAYFSIINARLMLSDESGAFTEVSDAPLSDFIPA